MPLDAALLKKLALRYPPNTVQHLQFRGLVAAVHVGPDGRAWHLFLGHRNRTGRISGERYVRIYKEDADGRVIKDHWDRKGKAS